MTKWARVQLPTGNGIVQETTTSDPTGKFHPSIVWIEVTAGNSPGGNTNAVGVRYSYESGQFIAPVFQTGNTQLFNSGSFIPSVSFTGTGAWNWTTIGVVNILATTNTTQVISYSTQLFDSNLVVAPTTIVIPSGAGYDNYQGGANTPPGGVDTDNNLSSDQPAAIGGLTGFGFNV